MVSNFQNGSRHLGTETNIDTNQDDDPISRLRTLQISINTRAHETKDKIATTTLASNEKSSPLLKYSRTNKGIKTLSSSFSSSQKLESRDDYTFGGRQRSPRIPSSIPVKSLHKTSESEKREDLPTFQRIDFNPVYSSHDSSTLISENSFTRRSNYSQIKSRQNSSKERDDQKADFETMMQKLSEKEERISRELKKLEETQQDLAHFMNLDTTSLHPIQEVIDSDQVVSKSSTLSTIGGGINQQHQDDGSGLSIVAPANLPHGFIFDTYINGEKFKFKVPKGGVKEGQIWKNPIIIPEHLVYVPVGVWRDRLWNVFAHGIFHPLVILSFMTPLCKFLFSV